LPKWNYFTSSQPIEGVFTAEGRDKYDFGINGNKSIILLMIQILLVILIAIGIYLYFTQKTDTVENKNVASFDPNNYELRSTLMTQNERQFFEKLRLAVGDRYDIYPQYNLDKIFKTKYLQSKFLYNGAKWVIDRKSIDFLVTNRDTQSPFIGIELDDLSHQREDRIARDEKVATLFKTNGIGLVRFNSSDQYNVEDIKNVFERHY